MSTSQPVTIWKRYDSQTKVWSYNHFDEGHVRYNQEYPLPKVDCAAQRAWKNSAWIKRYGYLTDGALTK